MKKFWMTCLLIVMVIALIGAFLNRQNKEDSVFKDPLNINNEAYFDTVRGYANDLYNISSSNRYFSSIGSETDLEKVEYLKKAFNDIGLVNIGVENIPINVWECRDLKMVVNCQCGDNATVTIQKIGTYPSNFNFDGKEGIVYYVESLDSINTENIKDKIVVLPKLKDLEEVKGFVESIIDYDPMGIVYSYFDENESESYSVNTDYFQNIEVPIFCIPYNTYKAVLHYINVSAENETDLMITLYGNSTIQNEISNGLFVVGEIEGKNRDNCVYVIANRDSIYSEYFGSCVNVGELLAIAERLKEVNDKPEYTLKFVVSAGEEWCLKGKGRNEGLKYYLENNIANEMTKGIIYLNGSYPVINTAYTETIVSDEIYEEVVANNAKFFELYQNSPVVNNVKKIDKTDFIADIDVPVIICDESKYTQFKVANSSKDNNNIDINKSVLNFIIEYYVELIKNLY